MINDKGKKIIDKYLIENGATIKVLVDNRKDYFNKFDPLENSINTEVVNYITEEANNIPFKYKLLIDFYSDELNEKEKEKIRRLIKEYYGMQIINNESIIRTNSVKALSLLLLGAIIIAYTIIGKELFGAIFMEVVYVMGWVLLWEGTEILLLSNSAEKVKNKNYKQIYNSEIVFSDKLEN